LAIRTAVISIRPLNKIIPMYDITTETGDFIANGVVSHNCYARPYHEYLGMSAGLDFETKIMVKENAPELLRAELSSSKWVPQPVAISGVTDAYQPVERKLQLTRRCLEVLAEFRNPVIIITKNHLVTRDADLLAKLASHNGAAVLLSITTLDPELARVLEPRTSTPSRRLAAIEVLAKAGVPVGVNVAPVIPGLTDHELMAIVEAARNAGATFAGKSILRLPHAVKDLFEAWMTKHRPLQKEKVLGRIREMRGGILNDADFHSRMSGKGVHAEHISAMFDVACRKTGMGERPKLSADAFQRPPDPQLELPF
jgi:DNA repair photolyase